LYIPPSKGRFLSYENTNNTTKNDRDVLVSSIICNLRRAYPDAQIDYLVNQQQPVLEGNPNIDTIIRFEEKHRKQKKNS
jgi:heptosyltransferase-2